MNGKKRTHQWRELIRRKRFDTNRKFGRDVLLPRPLLAVFLVVSGRGGARRARGITVTVRHQLLAREVVPVIDRLGMVTFGTKKKENRALGFFFPCYPLATSEPTTPAHCNHVLRSGRFPVHPLLLPSLRLGSHSAWPSLRSSAFAKEYTNVIHVPL
jgi:hypothetical protein